MTQDKLKQIRAKHTRSLYLGEHPPEIVLQQKIELLKACIKQASESLEEYRTFIDWYMTIEGFSVAVVLTITHKEHVTACEIEKFNSDLEELYEDAKIMRVEVDA
ncbi:hypothetical protein M5X00_25870 [Paenibacillus alvei]|uniref:hypothetical protein n=1 Tax=Paenibacillus alvei TaxID=44250 RepID=UPI0022818280|nr:hypothetical protein [Paenibacillus alvei]MCY9757658.1 hypothetical protein [Paenibacillus alvei]